MAEILGLAGKFGLGVQDEAGQSLTEFCPPQGSAVLGSAVWLRIPQSDLTGPAGHAAGSMDGTACADLASAGAERMWES